MWAYNRALQAQKVLFGCAGVVEVFVGGVCWWAGGWVGVSEPFVGGGWSFDFVYMCEELGQPKTHWKPCKGILRLVFDTAVPCQQARGHVAPLENAQEGHIGPTGKIMDV